VQGPELSAFPVALNLRGRRVLVVGGGDEAAQKVPRLLQAGAHVTVVAARVEESLARAAATRALVWFARELAAGDTCGQQIVLLTLLDEALAQALRRLADVERFLLGAIDQPAFSDFFLVSTVTSGPVQIAISTSGRAPLLARRLRQALAVGLDARFGEFARNFAELRARVRGIPKAERSEVLEQALVGFAMEVRLRYPEPDGHADLPPEKVREL
jgi:siroheme synthase-like protein